MPNQGLTAQKCLKSRPADLKSFFQRELGVWNEEKNTRSMPWKGEKNPYRIWLSEIILQQTRVEQGWKYYQNFIDRYPFIVDLASAPESEIYKLWEGLGYYSRCKNMIATAKLINGTYKGIFPKKYDDIRTLKGVGPYTAAAIASFAFNLSFAVVDGNVYRLLSRYFGISLPIDTTEGKKYFLQLATELLSKTEPGIYNQAIIDFGATICKPVPLCRVCPLKTMCIAYNQDMVKVYPVKRKKPSRTIRWFYYIVAELGDDIFIRLRNEKDIWQNLHDLILIESKTPLTPDELYQNACFKTLGELKTLDISRQYQQHLTHQTIKGQFIHVRLFERPDLPGYINEKRKDILKLAFPKFITSYFDESKLLK